MILTEDLLCAKHTQHFCPLNLFSTPKPGGEILFSPYSKLSPGPHFTQSKGQSPYNIQDLPSPLELLDIP